MVLTREARPKEKTAFLGREDPGATRGNWRRPEEALAPERATAPPVLPRGGLSAVEGSAVAQVVHLPRKGTETTVELLLCSPGRRPRCGAVSSRKDLVPLHEGAVWAHSDPEERDLQLCKCLCVVLLRCSGGIAFPWPELYSQGVCTMVCLLRRWVLACKEEPREQAGGPAPEHDDRGDVQPPLRVPVPFTTC